jgi:hypothetical protein
MTTWARVGVWDGRGHVCRDHADHRGAVWENFDDDGGALGDDVSVGNPSDDSTVSGVR